MHKAIPCSYTIKHPCQQQTRQGDTGDDGFFLVSLGISIFPSFPRAQVLRHHHTLEDPKEPPFTVSREIGVSLEVAMIPLGSAAVTAILL